MIYIGVKRLPLFHFLLDLLVVALAPDLMTGGFFMDDYFARAV